MVQRILPRAREVRHRGRALARRALGGLALVLMHELDALTGHYAEVRERLTLARRARGVGELLRDQVDLLAETRARLLLDHRERRALLHRWLTDLRDGSVAA